MRLISVAEAEKWPCAGMCSPKTQFNFLLHIRMSKDINRVIFSGCN